MINPNTNTPYTYEELAERVGILEQRLSRMGQRVRNQAVHIIKLEASRKALRTNADATKGMERGS